MEESYISPSVLRKKKRLPHEYPDSNTQQTLDFFFSGTLTRAIYFIFSLSQCVEVTIPDFALMFSLGSACLLEKFERMLVVRIACGGVGD